MKITYKLEHNDNLARAGVIKTNHGFVDTPVFMPVGTQATVKTLSNDEITSLGAGIILANTYHLWLRPTNEVIKKSGGIHQFMNYHGPILTDSGGFQVFSLATPKNITEEGVAFKSHINGDDLFLTPELSIQIQNDIDSDIAMSFDECIPYPASYDYVKTSVDRTLRWAKRGKTAHQNDMQSLFGIVQGGEYADLRQYSAKETVKIGFDGYAIGGTSVGESKPVMYQMIKDATPYLPTDKPRYLMGVGDPLDILEAIDQGIDMFDCVLPTRIARHAQVFTKNGKMTIKNAQYKDDFTPIESDCICYTCQHHHKAYLRHLIISKETLGGRLLTIHNLHFLITLTKQARVAILNNNYQSFKQQFIKKYQKQELN